MSYLITFSLLLAAAGQVTHGHGGWKHGPPGAWGHGGTPSTKELGDITILAQDNLRITDAPKTSAALLLNSARSQYSAQQACASLSEDLWSPSLQDFKTGLNNSLNYQVFTGRVKPDQLFWVASDVLAKPHWQKQRCTALDVSGTCHSVPCSEQLPALCTHSAPASTSTSMNTSAPFQIAQSVGEQTLVGYRDFYTFQFRGVRFAQEPERFTYSSTYTNATGTNTALEGAPECLQAPNNGSTDCLFLNLWTSSLPGTQQSAKKDLKPVMVYIYGGGFSTGSASNPTNDGSHDAARGDVVVVDIAYRLNSLGFLALNDGVHNGNYWISDLISGLEWVQKYISAFGGDSEQVMIFGESAGAQSVQALLASPKAIGLFRGAIMQSNYNQPYVSIPDAYNSTTIPILNVTGCSTSSNHLACLQAYNASALINLRPNFNYPVIDGTYLVTPYIDLNASAAGNTTSSVPVISSVNRDEAGILISLPTTTNYTQAVLDLSASEGQNSPDASAVLSHPSDFPLGTGPTNNNTALNQVFNTTARIYTDTNMHCSDEFVAVAAAATGVWPSVYFAEFNRTYQEPDYNTTGVCGAPITPAHPFGDPELEYFKCHAGELPLSFGTFAYTSYPERDEHDLPFSQLIVDYWTSFARTLDPNPDMAYLEARGYWDTINQIEFSGPWETVNASKPEMMELQWDSAMRPFPDGVQCSLLGQPRDALL